MMASSHWPLEWGGPFRASTAWSHSWITCPPPAEHTTGLLIGQAHLAPVWTLCEHVPGLWYTVSSSRWFPGHRSFPIPISPACTKHIAGPRQFLHSAIFVHLIHVRFCAGHSSEPSRWQSLPSGSSLTAEGRQTGKACSVRGAGRESRVLGSAGRGVFKTEWAGKSSRGSWPLTAEARQ